jgi:hypothetical protein
LRSSGCRSITLPTWVVWAPVTSVSFTLSMTVSAAGWVSLAVSFTWDQSTVPDRRHALPGAAELVAVPVLVAAPVAVMSTLPEAVPV